MRITEKVIESCEVEMEKKDNSKENEKNVSLTPVVPVQDNGETPKNTSESFSFCSNKQRAH